MSLAADRKLDCVGLFCPMPILKTRDAMKGMAVGETLEMLGRPGLRG
jgi:TusA-related sulfurtransferase